ncbi:hypothetical protein Rumeso_00696 [Rubellimicrobium mesophilum DSM 19309]|uniref:Uncharacterized protein n=1 Tax=Rubellimicrobium mesophilum DSM 19309 TaxID=442562 RepID=A0A017HUA2_9RHOB|nr:hypothetical protein [Rubellimicrobium mesophilum]EYD77738.1 hypothetical protein Rumeso_00696 [Rubellimicrobium mesophilum DSM 19309]
MPFSTEESYIQARAGLSLDLGTGPQVTELKVQWARADYSYGKDAAGRRIGTSEHMLLAAVQMRF